MCTEVYLLFALILNWYEYTKNHLRHSFFLHIFIGALRWRIFGFNSRFICFSIVIAWNVKSLFPLISEIKTTGIKSCKFSRQFSFSHTKQMRACRTCLFASEMREETETAKLRSLEKLINPRIPQMLRFFLPSYFVFKQKNSWWCQTSSLLDSRLENGK